jgi:DNA-directed RNA polymerase subunit RPC12/RpoP
MKTIINHKSSIIRCPHCGAEYLPGEIFMPGAFLGRSEDIVKDSFGKIIYEDYKAGQEPDMLERYICDYCDKPFVVEATVTYKTREEEPENDFKTQYVSLID